MGDLLRSEGQELHPPNIRLLPLFGPESHEEACSLVAPVQNNNIFTFFFLSFAFFFFGFLWSHLWHMEVPRLGVKSELQLPAYTTATATPDLAPSVTYTTAHGDAGSLPIDQGHRSNPNPHKYQLGLIPRSHSGNSSSFS